MQLQSNNVRLLNALLNDVKVLITRFASLFSTGRNQLKRCPNFGIEHLGHIPQLRSMATRPSISNDPLFALL